MKLTLFTNCEACKDIISVECSHISMFEKHRVVINFSKKEEQLRLLQVCIENYILIEVQGSKITILPEIGNHQRVRFRFDS